MNWLIKFSNTNNRQKIEYQVRTIDEYGEIIDMPFSGSKIEAIKFFNNEHIGGEVLAIIIEKQVYRQNMTPGYEWDGEPIGLPEYVTGKGDIKILQSWTEN